jgi:hypothetical protein
MPQTIGFKVSKLFANCYWKDAFFQLSGGRPMLGREYSFTDKVSGKPVYRFTDRLGRAWLAEHKWSAFRVRINNQHNKGLMMLQ